MKPDGGDSSLSDEAREVDDHARELIADLTGMDVRRRFTDLLNWRMVVAVFLLVLAISTAVVYTRRSTEPVAATVESAQALDPANRVSAPVGSAANDPLNGTWIMYATGSDGIERHTFTVQFVGSNTGVVEILEDTTEFDATFTLAGDQVSFTFTRILDLDTGDWSETSVFGGALVGADEISGEYARENWSCLVDRDPPCAYEAEPLRFPSRLVRQP